MSSCAQKFSAGNTAECSAAYDNPYRKALTTPWRNVQEKDGTLSRVSELHCRKCKKKKKIISDCMRGVMLIKAQQPYTAADVVLCVQLECEY